MDRNTTSVTQPIQRMGCRNFHFATVQVRPSFVIPAKAGIQAVLVQTGTGNWIPAFAGMTVKPSPGSIKSAAFTLLEICLALFIVMLMLAAVIPFTAGWLSESRLRQPADRLQLFAKTARNLAISERRPFEIEFAKDGFTMRVADSNTDVTATNETAALDYALPAGMQYRLQRWKDPEWRPADGQRWTFQPTGLCDPLRIRFSNGETWLQVAFNPLTAVGQHEAYFFR